MTVCIYSVGASEGVVSWARVGVSVCVCVYPLCTSVCVCVCVCLFYYSTSPLAVLLIWHHMEMKCEDGSHFVHCKSDLWIAVDL